MNILDGETQEDFMLRWKNGQPIQRGATYRSCKRDYTIYRPLPEKSHLWAIICILFSPALCLMGGIIFYWTTR